MKTYTLAEDALNRMLWNSALLGMCLGLILGIIMGGRGKR